jgi:hypothetical protein
MKNYFRVIISAWKTNVYKQWVNDGCSLIVSMTFTVGEFTEEICQTADQATARYYTAKLQSSYLKVLKSFCQT